MGLLHQLDFAGQSGLAGVASLFHGGSPDRFSMHIETEGAQIAVPKGFKVDDGGVNSTLTGREYGIFGKPFTANPGDVGGKLISRNEGCKPDPLHTGNTSVRAQLLKISLPLLPVYGV